MPRSTMQTNAVLAVLLSRPAGRHYGFQIAKDAGLQTGTVYPILARLESDGWLESNWEAIEPGEEGRPRRRYYQLSAEGARASAAQLRDAQRRLAVTAWRPGIAGAPA